MSRHVKPEPVLLSRDAATLRLQLMAAEYLERMGETIAAAMEAKKWTQGDLARAIDQLRRRDDPEAAHVEPSSISRYKRGKVEPNPEMKQYLADALGITVAELMGPAPDKTKTPDLMSAVKEAAPDRLDLIEEKLDAVLMLLAPSSGKRTAAAQDALAEAQRLAEETIRQRATRKRSTGTNRRAKGGQG